MQLCTSLQTDNHASTPPLSFFTGRLPFLPPNQQRQGTLKPNIENYMSLLKMVAYFFLDKLQIAQVFRRLNVLCVTRPAVIWCQKVKSIGFCFFLQNSSIFSAVLIKEKTSLHAISKNCVLKHKLDAIITCSSYEQTN